MIQHPSQSQSHTSHNSWIENWIIYPLLSCYPPTQTKIQIEKHTSHKTYCQLAITCAKIIFIISLATRFKFQSVPIPTCIFCMKGIIWIPLSLPFNSRVKSAKNQKWEYYDGDMEMDQFIRKWQCTRHHVQVLTEENRE